MVTERSVNGERICLPFTGLGSLGILKKTPYPVNSTVIYVILIRKSVTFTKNQ